MLSCLYCAFRFLPLSCWSLIFSSLVEYFFFLWESELSLTWISVFINVGHFRVGNDVMKFLISYDIVRFWGRWGWEHGHSVGFSLFRLSHFTRKWNGSVHCDIISLFFLFRRFLVLILFVRSFFPFSLCFFQSSRAMSFQNSRVRFFLTVQRSYPCQKRCLLISSHGSSKLADDACKIRLNWFGKMPRKLRPCSWRFARSISLATSGGIPQSMKNFSSRRWDKWGVKKRYMLGSTFDWFRVLALALCLRGVRNWWVGPEP